MPIDVTTPVQMRRNGKMAFRRFGRSSCTNDLGNLVADELSRQDIEAGGVRELKP